MGNLGRLAGTVAAAGTTREYPRWCQLQEKPKIRGVTVTSLPAQYLKPTVLSICVIGFAITGLFVESSFWIVVLWTLFVVGALAVTAEIWSPMFSGASDFRYATFVQLWILGVLASIAIDGPLIAIPCLAGGIAISFALFRTSGKASDEKST